MSTFDQWFTPVEELRKTEPEYFKLKRAPAEDDPVKRRRVLDVFLNKTPLSILEEGAKGVYQQAPVWVPQEYPGPNNSIEFEMTCMLAGVSGTARAGSKKLAKHKAAIEYLHQVVKKGRHKEFFIPGETEEDAHKNIDMLKERTEDAKRVATVAPVVDKSSASGEDGQVPIAHGIPEDKKSMNWVGKLQELLQKNKMPNPEYEFEEENGKNNSKNFTVTCTVSKQKAIGVFANKKFAKTIAAYVMCELLETGLEDMDKDLLCDVDDEEDSEEAARILEIEQAAFRIEDSVEALKTLLSDRKKFASYEMTFKTLTNSTFGKCQTILEVKVVLAPEEDTEELQLGAEHTNTEEMARTAAARDRERKRDLDAPLGFCGVGENKEGAEKNACRSALVFFNTIS